MDVQVIPSFFGYVPNHEVAQKIFQLAETGKVEMVKNRLSWKKASVVSGMGFVYDEQTSNIKRWTDGLSWSDSIHSGGRSMVYREATVYTADGVSTRYEVPDGLRKKTIADTISSKRLICYYKEHDISNPTDILIVHPLSVGSNDDNTIANKELITSKLDEYYEQLLATLDPEQRDAFIQAVNSTPKSILKPTKESKAKKRIKLPTQVFPYPPASIIPPQQQHPQQQLKMVPFSFGQESMHGHPVYYNYPVAGHQNCYMYQTHAQPQLTSPFGLIHQYTHYPPPPPPPSLPIPVMQLNQPPAPFQGMSNHQPPGDNMNYVQYYTLDQSQITPINGYPADSDEYYTNIRKYRRINESSPFITDAESNDTDNTNNIQSQGLTTLALIKESPTNDTATYTTPSD